jgi:hypothetical protein
MPKAKPVSLFPLTFDEAITAILKVDPQRVGIKKKTKAMPKKKNGKA